MDANVDELHEYQKRIELDEIEIEFPNKVKSN